MLQIGVLINDVIKGNIHTVNISVTYMTVMLIRISLKDHVLDICTLNCVEARSDNDLTTVRNCTYIDIAVVDSYF